MTMRMRMIPIILANRSQRKRGPRQRSRTGKGRAGTGLKGGEPEFPEKRYTNALSLRPETR